MIGVIGAGRWGKNIIATLYELGALSAIAETDAQLRSTLTQQYPDIPIYNDCDTLLNSDVSAVTIATPVVTHYKLCKQALACDKDVFVEKPMAMTVEQCDDLVQCVRASGQIFMVGHMLLYQPAITAIKAFIDQGRLGKLYRLSQTRCNLGTIRTQENVLYSLGVHDLAVLSYLIGKKVQRVVSVSQSIINPHVEDCVHCHLSYPDNVQAHLHVNWLWPIKERHLMIQGEKGALFFDELKQRVVYYRNYGNADATVTQGGEEIVFEGNEPPLKKELMHFINCITTRQTPLSDVTQGRDVVALLQATTEQLREELTVEA